MRRVKLIIAVILFCLGNPKKAFSQNIFIPTEFVKSPIPQKNLDFNEIMNSKNEMLELNRSKDFEVSIKNDSLKINLFKAKTKELRVFEGLLIAIDNGEFLGGGLKFISDADKSEKYIISNRNISSVFEYSGRVFFIEKRLGVLYRKKQGVKRKEPINGVLFEIYRVDKTFIYKQILNFEDTPMAFAIFKDMIFIASYSGFYMIKNMEKQLIFKDLFWKGLFPNSIAVKNEENIFVGIRGGVVKLNLNNKNIEFYKYSPN